MKTGDWIFTCKMQPMQFDSYIHKGEDFKTTDGSHHSIRHCGCNPVSKEYAQWFIENKIWEIWDEISETNPESLSTNIWELYQERIEQKCKLDNITYEGF